MILRGCFILAEFPGDWRLDWLHKTFLLLIANWPQQPHAEEPTKANFANNFLEFRHKLLNTHIIFNLNIILELAHNAYLF